MIDLSTVDNFLDRIFKIIKQQEINVEGLELDHLCFRVETEEEYNKATKQLSKIGSLLSEAIIAGRNISTFKLDKPIYYQNYEIDCIEIPAPGKGKNYKTGWEHAEFVLEKGFSDFIKKHPHIEFNKKSMQKAHNPDIKVTSKDIKGRSISIKFHLSSLEQVIEEENMQKLKSNSNPLKK